MSRSTQVLIRIQTLQFDRGLSHPHPISLPSPLNATIQMSHDYLQVPPLFPLHFSEGGYLFLSLPLPTHPQDCSAS